MSIANYIRIQNIRGIGAKRINQILNNLSKHKITLDEFFNLPLAQLTKDFGLNKTLAENVFSSKPCPNEILEKLESKNIKIVVKDSPDYPLSLTNVLGEDAPPILYMWGNLDLLKLPSVGFCGSRDVTQKGIEVTKDTACQIARKKWAVVSGHARGVDTAAHQSALECGSSTILVLPEGILDFKMRPELRAIAKPAQILIVSEFSPTSRWSVGNAMTRNKTILGLSDAMILVESRLEGGTFEAGKSALKLQLPLYVVEYKTNGESSEGNRYFLEKGALAVKKSAKTNRANILSLVRTINKKRKLKDVKNTKINNANLVQPTLVNI